MGICIILILCVIIGGFLFYLSFWGDVCDFLLGGFIGLLVGIVICSIFAGVGVSDNYTYTQPITISAIQDNASSKGEFYLRGGYVEGDLSYSFCYGDPENGFQIKTVSAEKCVVKFTDKEPYFQQKEQLTNWFGKFLYSTDKFTLEEYVIYIPEGTMINDFKIDLQ